MRPPPTNVRQRRRHSRRSNPILCATINCRKLLDDTISCYRHYPHGRRPGWIDHTNNRTNIAAVRARAIRHPSTIPAGG